jgi:hypothetical protein
LSRGHHIPVSGALMLLLLPIAFVGAIASSRSHGTALTVTGPALYHANYGPSPLPGGREQPGEYVAYSAESVVPNGDAATNGVGVATTALRPRPRLPLKTDGGQQLTGIRRMSMQNVCDHFAPKSLPWP